MTENLREDHGLLEERTPFAAAFNSAFGDAEDGKGATMMDACIGEALCKANDFITLGLYLRALGYSEEEILDRIRAHHAGRPDLGIDSFLDAVLAADIAANPKAVVTATKAVLVATRELLPF